MTKTEALLKINDLEATIKAAEAGATLNAPWGLGYLYGKLTICRDVLADIEQKEAEDERRAEEHYAYALENGLAQ